MNQQNPEEVPHQTITLENEGTVCVFTEDGRVFYDMQAIVSLLSADLLRKVEENPDINPGERFYLLGQLDLLTYMRKETDTLSMTYSMGKVETVDDMFGGLLGFDKPDEPQV